MVTSYVVLSFLGKNMPKADLLSQSDCFLCLYMNGKLIGRTEVIPNDANPIWSTAIRVPYVFESVQKLEFKIYDADSKDLDNLSKHDFLGSVDTRLADIVVAPGNIMVYSLSGGMSNKVKKDSEAPSLTVIAEESEEASTSVTFSFTASALPKSGLFRKIRPILEIQKARENDVRSMTTVSWVTVYRSEVSKSAMPHWAEKTIGMDVLCSLDRNLPLRLRIVDTKTNKELFSIDSSYADLEKHAKSGEMLFTNPKSPRLSVSKWSQCEHTSFLDLVNGGLEIRLVVAVDLTASNGDPNSPSSLHFVGGTSPNDYQRALASVGEILMSYDSDKQIPCLGFGARPRSGGDVQHAFPLDPTLPNGEAHGVEGMLNAYAAALRNYELYGPTVLEHAIRKTIDYARPEPGSDEHPFTVMLVLTDGVLNDMRATTKAIVDASHEVPMALIIVGVGNADFTDMDYLDSDDKLLTDYTGRSAKFDIVQFVPFSEHANNATELAREVLEELPGQVLNYYERTGFKPAKFGANVREQAGFSSGPENVISAPVEIASAPIYM